MRLLISYHNYKQVVAEMEGDVQRIEGEQVQTQQLNRRGEELAHSLRELQGELAEYNIMLDKVGTDTDPGEVAQEAATIEEANALREAFDAAQTEQGGEDAAEQGKRRKTEPDPDPKPGAAKAAAAPPALAGLGDYGSGSDSGSDSDES